ncbi:Kinase [Hexamita inflata]|uniref:Kinase n=1 Tax=Hexamita inflata TaxID=28002 RepID=A0ABP1HR63_9EUKA
MFKKKSKEAKSNEPIVAKRGIHIEVDPVTGQLIGVPPEWADLGLIPKNMIGTKTEQVPQNIETTTQQPAKTNNVIELHTGVKSAKFFSSKAAGAREFEQNLAPEELKQANLDAKVPKKKLIKDTIERTIAMQRPMKFKHTTHVSQNQDTGEIEGLPQNQTQ